MRLGGKDKVKKISIYMLTRSTEASDPYDTSLLIKQLLSVRLPDRTFVPEDVSWISQGSHHKKYYSVSCSEIDIQLFFYQFFNKRDPIVLQVETYKWKAFALAVKWTTIHTMRLPNLVLMLLIIVDSIRKDCIAYITTCAGKDIFYHKAKL